MSLNALSPIVQAGECSVSLNEDDNSDVFVNNDTTIIYRNNEVPTCSSMPSYSLRDISTWIGGRRSF